jgi:hypothetical protein
MIDLDTQGHVLSAVLLSRTQAAATLRNTRRPSFGSRHTRSRPRWFCWIWRALDLLDFASAPVADEDETDFGCWIFVGFRAALNIRSHRATEHKHTLTCNFDWWAVTGSNRRPLRCKGGSGEFDYQRKRVSSQFRATFRVVSFRPS